MAKRSLVLGKASAMALRKLGSIAFKVPHRIFSSLIRLLMEVMSFPFWIMGSVYLFIRKTLLNLQRFVQVDLLLENEEACNKSVQVSGDEVEDLPCDKSVQVNGEIELQLPCNKSVQVNGESEVESRHRKAGKMDRELQCNSPKRNSLQVGNIDPEFKSPSRLALQSNGEPEFRSPCNISRQVNRQLGFESPRNRFVPGDYEFRSPCNKSVQVNSFQGIHRKSIQNENCRIIVSQEKDASYYQIPHINLYNEFSEKCHASSPPFLKRLGYPSGISHAEPETFETGPDYLKNSKICLARTLQDIDDLPKSVLDKDAKNDESATDPEKSQMPSKSVKRKAGFEDESEDSEEKEIEALNHLKDTFSGVKKVGGISEFVGNVKSIKDPQQTKEPASQNCQNGQHVLNLSLDVLHQMVDITNQETILLKQRLASSNSKIEAILLSSRTICDEMSKINERVNRLLILSSKIKDLQNYLCDGDTLLKEVEADRQEMNLKLAALARLIREEEEYLDDGSIESGYDEIETRDFSPSKH